MTENIIYSFGTHIMIDAGYSQPAMHQHAASHLIVGLDGENLTIKTDLCEYLCEGALIPSNFNHTVEYLKQHVLVFLFDYTSDISERITRFSLLSHDQVDTIKRAYCHLESAIDKRLVYHHFFNQVIESTKLKPEKIIERDMRIMQALDYIDANIQIIMSVDDVAKRVGLSSSRLSHLFKEQVGISLASYILMTRIKEVYMNIDLGMSITEASMLAGFSSPSHFATVNKKMFGITASNLTKSYTLYD